MASGHSIQQAQSKTSLTSGMIIHAGIGIILPEHQAVIMLLLVLLAQENQALVTNSNFESTMI
jgi:hypothetical protein